MRTRTPHIPRLPVCRACLCAVIGAVISMTGCTALSPRAQQIWRAATDHDYPSAPVGTPEFERALDRYTESAAHPAANPKLLQNGDEAYPEMLSLIENARHTIALETYIVENDATTDMFFAALTRAAARGVRVRVMVDAAGYGRSLVANLAELTDHGIEARIFNPFLLSWTILRANNRDHRKILAVDSTHAILGGINLSDEQTGDGTTGWRDTSLRISGEAAREAEKVFDESWQQAGRGWFGKTLPVPLLNPVKAALDAPFTQGEENPRSAPPPLAETPPAGTAATATARVVSSSPDRRNSPTHDLAVLGINGARERVDIACAYFVPPIALRRALLRAAERGVRIRLLLPEVTDVRFVREIGMRFYGEFLDAGIEIYEWPYPILHSKTMTVDGQWQVVGSANMDGRSYFLNYEAVLALSDRPTAEAAHAAFERDLRTARRLTPEAWRARGAKQRVLETLLIPLAGQY